MDFAGHDQTRISRHDVMDIPVDDQARFALEDEVRLFGLLVEVRRRTALGRADALECGGVAPVRFMSSSPIRSSLPK
jgi:hypothetical protein